MDILRALRGSADSATDRAFVTSLRDGSDEEREYALEALLDRGRTDAVAIALGDRVDALAARAALGLVGSTERKDYVTQLTPLVGAARTEEILCLLAGILE
jgi:hypothetical protein